METKPKSEHLLELKGNKNDSYIILNLIREINSDFNIDTDDSYILILLYLLVMRLTRPTLASPVVVTCDSTDLPGNTLNNELKNDCTALQGMETLAVGQFMVLPQSFGYVYINRYQQFHIKIVCIFFSRNIYLGEIFSSYLCVHNGSNQLVKNVTVKVSYIFLSF